MSRTLLDRLVILVWAALMLALPAAEAVADARIAAASGDVVAHVEGEQRRDCPRVHAHDCAICQHLGTTALPQGRALPRLPDAARVAPAMVAAGPSSTGWQASTRPRAPPHLG